MPVPLSGMVVERLTLLLAMEMLPVMSPVEVGAKVTVKVLLEPASIVVDARVIVKPAPMMLADEI